MMVFTRGEFMGVYSTLDITREDAIRLIIMRLRAHDCSLCSDEELSQALFAICGDRVLHNFIIVSPEDYEKSENPYRPEYF